MRRELSLSSAQLIQPVLTRPAFHCVLHHAETWEGGGELHIHTLNPRRPKESSAKEKRRLELDKLTAPQLHSAAFAAFRAPKRGRFHLLCTQPTTAEASNTHPATPHAQNPSRPHLFPPHLLLFWLKRSFCKQPPGN